MHVPAAAPGPPGVNGAEPIASPLIHTTHGPRLVYNSVVDCSRETIDEAVTIISLSCYILEPPPKHVRFNPTRNSIFCVEIAIGRYHRPQL